MTAETRASLAGRHTLAMLLLLPLVACLVPALAALRSRLAETAAVYLAGRSLAALSLNACLFFALFTAPALAGSAPARSGRAALGSAALHALLMTLVLAPFLVLAARLHPPAGLDEMRLAALAGLFALAAFSALAWRAAAGRWYATACALVVGLPLFLSYLVKGLFGASAPMLARLSPLGAAHLTLTLEPEAAWRAWGTGAAVLGVAAVAAIAFSGRERAASETV